MFKPDLKFSKKSLIRDNKAMLEMIKLMKKQIEYLEQENKQLLIKNIELTLNKTGGEDDNKY